MNFLNPWFLLGGLAAAVPVLLHLMRRDQARKQEFPTLMYLRRISKKTIRFQKLRHLLLLLARVLVLLLVVLAFMRPYRTSTTAAGAAGSGATVHVILMDNSMSMGYGDRWQRARQEASRIAGNAAAGDRTALVAFSDRAEVLAPASRERATTLAMIDRAAVGDRATRYAHALRLAEQLALDSGTPRRILHLISDFQRSGSGAEETSFRLTAGTELRVIDLGAAEYSNLAVTQLDAHTGVRGETLSIQCSVANFGSKPRVAASVTAFVDDKAVAGKSADLGPGESRALQFDLPAPLAGLHTLRVAVEDTSLSRDNDRRLIWDGRRETPVLVVGSPGRASDFFLLRALTSGDAPRFRVETMTAAELRKRGEWSAAVLVWNDAPLEDPSASERIARFVEGGGGLLLTCADDSWSGGFARSFATWLPFRPAPAQNRPAGVGKGDYVILTGTRNDHPVFQPFREPGSGSFSGARFTRHAHFSVGREAEVLATFDNGWPALAAASHGRGRVLLLAAPSDTQGSTLPLKAVYPPLWQEMVAFLDPGTGRKLSYDVGETLFPRELLLRATLSGDRIQDKEPPALAVLDPGRNRLTLESGREVVELEQAGIYEIRTPGRNFPVAVNAAVAESDLARGDAEAMSLAWSAPRGQGVDEPSAPAERAEQQARMQQFWAWILAAAALLFVAEGFLANLFVVKPGE